MFELLVPAEKAQLDKVNGDKKAYDRDIRPALMVRAIEELQNAGVEPDLWKVEGLDRRERLRKDRRDRHNANGRSTVGCIILGRGEDDQKVLEWLKTAASVPGFIGFAVGRTDFWQPLVDLRDQKKISPAGRQSKEMAHRYREFVDAFESARAEAGL